MLRPFNRVDPPLVETTSGSLDGQLSDDVWRLLWRKLVPRQRGSVADTVIVAAGFMLADHLGVEGASWLAE